MSGSHHTYIPWFAKDGKVDRKDWEREALEMMKTQRFCPKCAQFFFFVFYRREDSYLYLKSPKCDYILQLPRKRNRMETKWAKPTWK